MERVEGISPLEPERLPSVYGQLLGKDQERDPVLVKRSP